MNKEKNNHEKLIQKKLIVQLVIEANAQFGSDGTPCVSFLCQGKRPTLRLQLQQGYIAQQQSTLEQNFYRIKSTIIKLINNKRRNNFFYYLTKFLSQLNIFNIDLIKFFFNTISTLAGHSKSEKQL